MSKLAQKLASAPQSSTRIKVGPPNMCGRIYTADIEDAAAIDEFRHRVGESWRTAQVTLDTMLGLDPAQRIPNDKFRYHWNKGCGCWSDTDRHR